MVDTLAYMFTGAYPSALAPSITNPLGLLVNGQSGTQNINLQAGATYSAHIDATDPGGYQLGYQCAPAPLLVQHTRARILISASDSCSGCSLRQLRGRHESH